MATLCPIDIIPLWAIFVLATVILFAAAEIGFQLGKLRKRRFKDEDTGRGGTIVGAALGLLAFMLAFSFGIAGSIHKARKELVIEEANAIETAYLRAQLIPEPASSELQSLLREYVDVRIKGGRWKTYDDLKQAIAGSENLLDKMWAQSVPLVKENSGSIITGLFVESLNKVIDLHSKRLAAGRNRIPRSIGFTLLFVAVVTMIMMGYHGGLTGIRITIARIALILILTSVMLLIIELDRPGKTMIKLNQQAIIDVRENMEKTRH
jgi:hypothetical protein